jgi:hypothetical protein
MPLGAADLFLPIAANRFLITPISVLKGSTKGVDFISGTFSSRLKTEAF